MGDKEEMEKEGEAEEEDLEGKVEAEEEDVLPSPTLCPKAWTKSIQEGLNFNYFVRRLKDGQKTNYKFLNTKSRRAARIGNFNSQLPPVLNNFYFCAWGNSFLIFQNFLIVI